MRERIALQQIVALWSALTLRRRIIVVGATAAVFAGVLILTRMAATPGMVLLYAGLDAGTAGQVVQALEQGAVRHQVRGDAIYVEEGLRDQLRMTLAAEGLPGQSVRGYEILDGLSGFGTTSQMFDAAYWRAREGELARTILANPQVSAARVHIAVPAPTSFRRSGAPSASVTVTTRGGPLPDGRARALRFLVSSAVPGLRPEDVSVIDTERGLLLSGAEDGPAGNGAEARAAELRTSVERLLAARLGPGRAVVEVAIDTVTDRESIVEKRFDPQSRVAISTDTEQRTANAAGGGPEAVSVASNLPEGEAASGGTGPKSQNSETRERVNYEISETKREVLRTPGAVRRITVAVMVDGQHGTDSAGAPSWTPLPDSEMEALRDLVAAAVGFDPARGDIVTLKSLPFQPQAEAGTLAEPGMLPALAAQAGSILRLAVLAAVLLVLGLFVLRPILLAAARRPALASPALPPAQPGPAVLTGEIDDGLAPTGLTVVSGDGVASAEEADPVARLRRLIADRQEETAEILRGWMEERRERT